MFFKNIACCEKALFSRYNYVKVSIYFFQMVMQWTISYTGYYFSPVKCECKPQTDDFFQEHHVLCICIMTAYLLGSKKEGIQSVLSGVCEDGASPPVGDDRGILLEVHEARPHVF